MKKLISLFLTLALMLTVFGTVAMAATTPAIKILGEVTSDPIYITDAVVNLDNAVSSDGAKGKIIYTSSGTPYINYVKASVSDLKIIKTGSTVTYPYHRFLLLRADLSKFSDKEISTVKFAYTAKHYKTNGHLRVYKTSADWDTSTVTYDNAPTPIEELGYVRFDHNNDEKEIEKDITKLITSGDTKLSLRMELYQTDNTQSGNIDHKQGTYVKYAGAKYTTSPHLTVTYLDEVESITDKFTYKAEVAEGTAVRMLVGIYDSTGALLDVKTSGRLIAGTDKLSLPVDLTSYTTVASVKCFLWDADSLEPLMTPVEKAATVTATATE